jgi:hypothetical protein
MVTRASSARRRLISICSAGHLRPAVGALQRAFAMSLDQVEQRLLYRFTRPNVRDAAAILWPDSTSRTASCLNSSVVPRSRRLRHLHPLR